MDSVIMDSCSINGQTDQSSEQSSSLNLIIKKLGHELDEIRVRSLDNLISKIEAHLISEDDLSQHKQLFIKLFDLFNFEEFDQHEKVLNLLIQLVENSRSATRNIFDINGLNFLNSLKKEHSDNQSVRLKIDELLDLMGNSSMESTKISSSCMSQADSFNSNDLDTHLRHLQAQMNQNYDSSSHDQPSSARSHNKFDASRNFSHTSASNNSINEQFYTKNKLMLNSDSDQVSQNITHSSVFSSRSKINQQSFSINSNALSINTRNFFQNHQEEYKENCDKSTFYWLPLTQMDIQFLKTAENSLKSNDPKKIKSYCTFLQTIVFNDFPAEIFLQRSTILKILIDLTVKFTNSQESDEDISLLKCLITCFSYYLSKLIKRIRYVKDPATFCFKDFYSNGYDFFSKSIILNYGKKQDTSRSINCNTSLYSVESDTTSTISSIKSSARSSAQSTATIKSKNNSKFKSSISQPSLKKNQSVKSSKNDVTRYSLDESKTPQFEEEFQDIQQSIESFLAETNNENYETDINNMSTIRREQEWPVYSFCFRLIDTLLDNLNLIMVKNNRNQKLDTCLLPLICETLNGSIEILNETKLEWTGLNISETLVNLFRKINFNIRFLINKIESVSSEAYLNIKNRILYVFLVHCLAKIINLIYSSEETSILIPGELAETIFIILNDICLLDSFKSLSHVFPTLLINLDKNLYDIYILSNEICDSMKCACEFLQNFSQHSKQDLVQLAKKSLNFMDYHVCIELSAKIVEFASTTMSLDKEAEAFKADIEYLVTGCMMSKNDLIRVETYSAIYRIINDSINVQVATEINSKRYKNINFLLLNKVFYHYITFGLFDKSNQVKKSSEKILLHLLQCELLVPESFRLKLTQLIVIYMPYIQCFASQIETLGQCILKMSDDLLTPTINSSQSKQTEESLKLFLSPAIERLRCSMRYLFSKDKNLRKKGFLQTIGFLTKYHRMNQVDLLDETFQDSTVSQSFNLGDFYQRFIPDKYCDIAVRLRKKNRVFITTNNDSNGSVFQTENLIKIYNIFTSEIVDQDVRQNAGEQLAIMISTGDPRLHKAFINLDGVNYCIRMLKNSLIQLTKQKQHLFLNNIQYDTLTKIHSSYISCLCNVFYWNKEIRQHYLFDIELYRFMVKSLLICLKMDFKLNQDKDITLNGDHVPDSTIYSNIQEDLTIIFFMFLYNQVSCLDYYHQSTEVNQRFDLSLNLKEHLVIPFNMSKSDQLEIKHLESEQFKTFELTYRLESLIKQKLENYNQERTLNLQSDSSIDLIKILNRKLRLYWNFRWHGGSLLKLNNDLINNQSLISDTSNLNQIFNEKLLMDNVDKFFVQYSAPVCFYRQFCAKISSCSTHTDALSLFDLIDVLVSFTSEREDIDTEFDDEYEKDFYFKNSLGYFFGRFSGDWHLSLNRFASILPSSKSKMDQLLFSSSFRTIAKMLRLQAKYFDSFSHSQYSSSQNIDKWLFNILYTNTSPLLVIIKNFLTNYESDETRINSHLTPLCEFIKVYFDRLANSPAKVIDQIKIPSFELLKICIAQMQACEVEKFRNLNKLAIVINLIGSLLRVSLNQAEIQSTNEANNKLYLQLIKSLVQIINIFNIGRGGLSLSFMGNFITKSAHVSLLQLVKSCLNTNDPMQKTEIVRTVLCLKDEKNSLNGSSWLIPLILHREPQIRSISFCLLSIITSVQYGRKKLMTDKTSIWSIGFNVLLNQYESSTVRTQACAFLINLTQCKNSEAENNSKESFTISAADLKYLLDEINFYKKIAYILSSFYPFETYAFSELVEQNRQSSKNSQALEISICSPLLVSSICQLLYNLSILFGKESILMINKHSIIKLLISYVKPLHLLTSCQSKKEIHLSNDLIYMLQIICRFLNLCCQLDQNCILMFLNDNQHPTNNRFNLVFDLIECLTINSVDKFKLKPFFGVLFDLLSTFLNLNDDKSTVEMCLIVVSKCWQILTGYILNDLLCDPSADSITLNLIENALKFYSIYLAKLTQLVNSTSSYNLKILFDNILYLFDYSNCKSDGEVEPINSIGAQLAQKLIKKFDEFFMVENAPQNTKVIICNILKGLFVLSNTAKKIAVETGLIETLIEHLKYTHSKLNLKSLSLTKVSLKENPLVFDIQQCLLILKYLMSNNLEIKESLTKIGLHSLIHSIWCWSLQDQNLLKTSLSTLCTLTANNRSGVNAMSHSSISASTSNANSFNASSSSLYSQSGFSSLSLLSTIIKSLQKSFINQQLKSSFIIQKYAFSILTNCAQSNECKNLIWKSNLIQDFTQIDFQMIKMNSVKFNFKLEKLWLYFLVSLSFSQDGQQFFIKVDTNLLAVIIKFLDPMLFCQQNDFQQQQIFLIHYLALLILRNLSFNQANKSKLVSNSDYINTIIQYLNRNKSEKFHLLSLSALDSLLYDYQKSKVILKNFNCLKYLVELHEHYQLEQNRTETQNKILHTINNLIKILNE